MRTCTRQLLRVILFLIICLEPNLFAQAIRVSTVIEAEHYSDSYGMIHCRNSERCNGWGNDIQQCNNGDWVKYSSVSFMDGEFSYIDAYGMDTKDNNGKIEVRIDSRTGTLIGTIDNIHDLRANGVWSIYTTQLTKVTGVHDLFLVFKGSSITAGDTSIIGSFDRFELRGLTTVNPSVAQSVYVSTQGDDGSNGSLDKPFRTIAKASSVMKPGSTCFIRQGIYRETIRPVYTGLPGAPLTYTAYNGENVFISTLEPVTGWSLHSGSMYKAPMNWSLGEYHNQVFVDGEMMWIASSPNIDDVCLKINTWGDIPCYNDKQGRIFPLMIPRFTGFGTPIATPTQKPESYQIFLSSPELPPGLKNKPRDFFKGALYTNFVTWGIVQSSDPLGDVASNQALFTVTPTPFSLWWQISVTGLGRFSHAFNLLDAPREWFRRDSTLFVWLPDGSNPASHLMEAKKRSICADISSKSFVNLTGLKFIGGSIVMGNAQNCIVDRCEAKYTAHMDTMSDAEGGEAFFSQSYDPSDGTHGIYVSGENNVIKNSLIAQTAGSGVILDGRDNTVDNCIIRDCSYSHHYDAGVYIDKERQWDDNTAIGLRVTHNTMRNFGRSAIHTAWTGNVPALPNIIQYNDIGASMLLSGEGAAVYVYGGVGQFTDLSYNWFHDITDGLTAFIYLDDGSRNWRIHHNVFFNGEIFNPGSYNQVFKPNDGFSNLPWNNTIVDKPHNNQDNGGIDLIGYNCLNARSDTGLWKFSNPAQADFSLRAGSPAIDQGQLIPGISQRYKGTAPDLGAYEYGETPWKAGANWEEIPWSYPPLPLAAEKNIGQFKNFEAKTVLQRGNSRLTITWPGNDIGRVQIYNAAGALVKKVESIGSATISTALWPTGVYLVKTVHRSTQSASRIFIQ